MMIDLITAVDYLKNHDNYLILTHSHPDGDTLGSGIALKNALIKFGKQAQVVCCDPSPKKYHYLGEISQSTENYDVIVSVDVADVKLLGKEFERKFGDKIDLAIDHHGSNMLFAKKTLLDAKAAATCEIILEIIHCLEVEIDNEIANCIYTGLTTDTGCFRYSNVTPRTMRMGAEMIEYGADHARINTVMFDTKTKTFAALERLAVNSMQMFFNGKCAVITVTQDMYKKSGSDESEVDGIASLPRQIEGVLVGVTMREKTDGTFKASMRSTIPINVSEICGQMGGGGHPQASGCQLDGPADKALETIINNIKKYFDKIGIDY